MPITIIIPMKIKAFFSKKLKFREMKVKHMETSNTKIRITLIGSFLESIFENPRLNPTVKVIAKEEIKIGMLSLKIFSKPSKNSQIQIAIKGKTKVTI